MGTTAMRGLVAGAIGTLALDATTYADIALRGRPPSDVPATTLRALLARRGVSLGDDAERTPNRELGLAALGGYSVGVGVGLGYAVVSPLARFLPRSLRIVGVAAAAMVAGNLGPVSAGTTDPREWGAEGWLADIVPHLVYGMVTVWTFDAIGEHP